MSIVLIIVLVLVFGGGFGYWGNRQYGTNYPYAGPGLSIGTILVLLLILYLLHII